MEMRAIEIHLSIEPSPAAITDYLLLRNPIRSFQFQWTMNDVHDGNVQYPVFRKPG